MAKFDHRFWEISVEPSVLESVLAEPDLLAQVLSGALDLESLDHKAEQRDKALAEVLAIIETKLTAKQKSVVELYFFQRKTQQEIAAELGVPQQVVSKHLFGVMRGGRKVGGAIAKIQKLASQLGIDPGKWV